MYKFTCQKESCTFIEQSYDSYTVREFNREYIKSADMVTYTHL